MELFIYAPSQELSLDAEGGGGKGKEKKERWLL